ncbi:MAG: hypothetical protein Q9216_002145 [Gyalolechia sp. 2 TL-2023]
MITSTAQFDIVIVGAGPAGLFLAVCLARWGYTIKHIDKRSTPTVTGRADGIQPRSLHILRNMGLKREIMTHDPAKVYQVSLHAAFREADSESWDPSSTGEGIRKTGSWSSCPEFIDARYPFTTMLHQGFIERLFIEDMRKHGADIQRPWEIVDFENDHKDSEYPIVTTFKQVETGETETVRSRYLFGGEGARSFVRERLGFNLYHKDPVSHIWGVMDGVVRTDFPDIKMKCTIHSDHGSIMIIPRERNLVRLYIQLASSKDHDSGSHKDVTEAYVQASAKKILTPYYIEWDRVEWYSIYPISQGIVDRYSSDNRIFLGGDCCHTHSPKAGQGMNTAFHDALNLAWKLHHVEAGFANPSILSTYESERKLIAENLLEFDAKYAALFSQRSPSASEVSGSTKDSAHGEENEFIKTFKANQEFTSGYGIQYPSNEFNWSPNHRATSHLFIPNGSKIQAGYVLPSANATRVVDANIVHLEQEVPWNGSFRLFLFAGKPSKTRQALADLSTNLQRRSSFYTAYERTDRSRVSDHERDNPHSQFFTICTIFALSRDDIEISELLPALFARYSNHVYADDVWDKRVPEAQASAHEKMGVDTETGAVIVVRPDGHVGCAVQLAEGSGTADALDEYFGAFLTKKVGRQHLFSRM